MGHPEKTKADEDKSTQSLQKQDQGEADSEPQALGLGLEICKKIVPRATSVRDVAIGSCVPKDGEEKLSILSCDIDKGLLHFGIGNGDMQKLPTWQCSGKEKGPVRMKKGGIVSSVCTLADGRVAVGIIDRRRLLLLRWCPSGVPSGDGGSWNVERKIKLLCDPYRIDALASELLAVAGTVAEKKSVSIMGSSSKWGPGPHVAMAWLTSSTVKLLQCGELKFKAVALSLSDRLLIAASSDAEPVDGRSELWSYVVEAYDLPERPDDKARGSSAASRPPLKRHWKCEFDEQVQDVCAVTSKVAVYVVLPDSRRVAALDLRDGQWLVDVLDCGSSRPIRIDVTPRRRSDYRKEGEGSSSSCLLTATVLYSDSSISVHRVGVFD